MCPPGGFYVCARHSREDALLILSVCFCGPRWIRHPTFDGHNLKFKITAIMLPRNQIHSSEKCRKSEEERAFVLLRIAADICSESMIRLIVSEFHQLQISCVRITESWPNRLLKGQKLDSATITVVLQTDQARQAAIHFHKNNKYVWYSCGWKGLVAQEYQSTKPGQPPCSWNIDRTWHHFETREMAYRIRLREDYRMGAHDDWGQLVDCPQDCIFYDIDPH